MDPSPHTTNELENDALIREAFLDPIFDDIQEKELLSNIKLTWCKGFRPERGFGQPLVSQRPMEVKSYEDLHNLPLGSTFECTSQYLQSLKEDQQNEEEKISNDAIIE